MFGCGQYQGRGETAYTSGAPHTRTCPEFFARAPFVASCADMLRAWRAGTMGHIWDLPAPLVTYLDALDREWEMFDSHVARYASG